MALSVLIGFAGVFGAAEGIRASQSKSKREEHRSRKNNLLAHCPKSSQFSPILEGRRIVLSGDKLYLDTGTAYDVPFGHPFEGYYLAYPDAPYSGLVSTITPEAPIMNWIYVDRGTHEVKFGVRLAAEPHYTGPFDCTRQDRRMTFGGWEGFAAVKEGDFWGLYFDVDGDNLVSKVAPGTPVIELELFRKELKVRKPPPPPPPPPPGPEATPEQKEPNPVSTEENHAVPTNSAETYGVAPSHPVPRPEESVPVPPIERPKDQQSQDGQESRSDHSHGSEWIRGRRGRRSKAGQQQKMVDLKQEMAANPARGERKRHPRVAIITNVQDGRELPASPDLD